ncbi:MAG: hypothetical protein P9C48_10080 [Defluviicoccus sp.]|nr:hypothetical protein [Defluviicoccus sp.]MDG4609463.1 hypothetical protein [Defluviicoccus sp.]
MPNHKILLASIILFASIVAVVAIAVAPLADEAISPPAARTVAGTPLGSQPITASAAAAGMRDQQGGEGSLAPAGPILRTTLWSDPTARGGLDFDRHPFLSTFVVVGTILAGLVITGRIRREQDDGPERDQPAAADSAVVAKGSVAAKKAPPRPQTDPT